MTDNSLTRKGQPLACWEPEDPHFWRQTGQAIARRNLMISVPCLLLSFCVWMLFSAVAVNLPKAGFRFTTDELFLLTALPSVSGALLRVPYAFMVPMIGGRRWTAISTAILILPCLWLGIAVQDSNTSLQVFMSIALLCGFAGANFSSSMGNISFFYPKSRQGAALGINGGIGNMGVSVMQLIAPLVMSVAVFGAFNGNAVTLPEGGQLWLQNAAWIWIPFLMVATLFAWFGMHDLACAKASLRQQLPVLARADVWLLGLLYLATFGSFIGFSAGFTMLTRTQFPHADILRYAFFGPFIGALARSIGGMISDRLGGVRVTLVNYLLMALLSALVFLTLPGTQDDGYFFAFYAVFMLLFFTAGLGSGSTFQMIATLFRARTLARARARGVSDEAAQQQAATDTSAALGFISAIGAIGGFFIPNAFGISLKITGSAAGAMGVFLGFYLICALITAGVYGRKSA